MSSRSARGPTAVGIIELDEPHADALLAGIVTAFWGGRQKALPSIVLRTEWS